MSYLNQNIKYLRKKLGYTQDILAKKIGVKRSAIGAYEEERAEPKISTIQKLSYLFDITMDELINANLNTGVAFGGIDTAGRTLRVLPIAIDENNNEKISIVPEKAEAGYAHSYADPEYISDLPTFALPITELYQDATYRLFQISGDSMLPIVSGSYIISSYLTNWLDIKDGQCYIVVTRDNGIVYKRLYNEFDQGRVLLKSDNQLYEAYTLPVSDIVEIWQAKGYISMELPSRDNYGSLPNEQLNKTLANLQEDVAAVKDFLINTKNEA